MIALSREYHPTRSEPCSNCGHELDCASLGTPGQTPKPGDASICIACAHVTMFDATMRRRELTPDEWTTVLLHQEVMIKRRSVLQVAERRRARR